MKTSKWLIATTLLAVNVIWFPVASALVIGQADTFEDGTTQNWLVGILGTLHPAPPVNVPDGGPAGGGDNYLRLTSVGGQGAGSRLTVVNPASQWAGDYTAAGITRISMDLINLGETDLSIRLLLENPKAGPPTDEAITSAFFLPAGSGWTHIDFAIDPASLIELLGDVNTLLSDVTALRIFHSPNDAFPGPSVVAMLGVDNITAASVRAVPEASALSLLLLGLVGIPVAKKARLGTVRF